MNASDEATTSLWMDGDKEPIPAAPLDSEVACDVAIVGGGMAGLSAAYELSIAGRSVVVVDRGRIGGGMTGRTTAHLAPICDDYVSALIERRGAALARSFHESQFAAVDRIEEIVERHAIACDFRRLHGFLFPPKEMPHEKVLEMIRKEEEAAWQLGLEVEGVVGVPFEGLRSAPALRFPHQATFHPLAYLKALAQAIVQQGGRLYGRTAVSDIEETDGQVRLLCGEGPSIKARHAIFATNAPINNRVAVHSKMAPYRTYAMAFDLGDGRVPDALYWDMAEPYHYVRLHRGPEGALHLIAGGEDHKAGEDSDGPGRFAALERWTRNLVPGLGVETHRWSGQVLETIDYCGFIGRNDGSERIFIAAGDSGQGMTHGALAGLLLSQLILSGSSPWEETYDPSRKPVAAALDYVSENVTAVSSFAEYLTGGELDSADALRAGQGGILRQGLQKLAVCRDAAGVLHVHSAACTHLGCIVHWNAVEQCWDCRCHGSHFAPDGTVLNGPALQPLAPANLQRKTTG